MHKGGSAQDKLLPRGDRLIFPPDIVCILVIGISGRLEDFQIDVVHDGPEGIIGYRALMIFGHEDQALAALDKERSKPTLARVAYEPLRATFFVVVLAYDVDRIVEKPSQSNKRDRSIVCIEGIKPSPKVGEGVVKPPFAAPRGFELI